MKKELLIFTLIIAVTANAKDTLDVTKDIPLLSSHLKNLNCDSVHGDAALLNALFTYKFEKQPSKTWILYFPKGSVCRLDSQVMIPSYVKLIFSPSARVVSTHLLNPTVSVWKTIGSSGVEFYNMKYTNHQSGYFVSVIEMLASPRRCFDNKIYGCKFTNIWASSAIRLGFIGNSDSAFWLDRMVIEKDTIINNFNPSVPHMRSIDDYHTNIDCIGVDVGNDYKQLTLKNLYILHTGGDGVYGLGLTKLFSRDKRSGNLTVTDCYIRDNNMQIEISGDYPLNNPVYTNNRLYYPTFIGGFNLSVQGRSLKIINNLCVSADNGNIEAAFYGGIATRNKCYNTGWKNSTQGWHHGAYTKGSSRIANIEIYGFAGDIYNNIFSQDPANRNPSSPDEFNGICILGKAANDDTTFDRNSYGTYRRFMGHFHIHDNVFTGQTHRIIDNSTASLSEDIVFENNTITTSNLTGTDGMFWIKGFRNKILRNKIDVTGSRNPVNDNGIIKKVAGDGEVVEGNIFKGPKGWIANTPRYKFFQQ